MNDRPRKLGNNTLPPEGAALCSRCQFFAYGGTKNGHHCVKSGGVWHHPSCPELRQVRPNFDRVMPARAPSATERMLILFRPLGVVLFHLIGAVLVSLVVVFVLAMMNGCAAAAKDAYQKDLEKCVEDNSTREGYERCKAEKKIEWGTADAGRE